ncbi:hypothetical protein PGT21_009359 [Puccinia graminis f. sp. tritici]|uniref:Uncharacterized protein n=1 Tax=Puccinia graminis f. sp. tritici TaxID=56615 RepID=A0A5B0M5N4_PUCGR|nr:hypothetical protein PGT21_009359 [Puccinia graminis f. sp. tritici]
MKFPLRIWLIVLAVHLIKAGFIPPNTSRVQLEGFGKTKIIPENSSAGSSLKLSHDERVHWGNIDRPSCDLSLKPWNVGTVADDHPAGPPLSDCETDAAATNGGSPDLNQTIRPVFPLKSAGVREIEFMGEKFFLKFASREVTAVMEHRPKISGKYGPLIKNQS